MLTSSVRFGDRTRSLLGEGEAFLRAARLKAARAELEDAAAALPLKGQECRHEYETYTVGSEGRDDKRRVSECDACGASCALGAFYRARLASREAGHACDRAYAAAGHNLDAPEVQPLHQAHMAAAHAVKVAAFTLRQAEQRLHDATCWLRRAEAGMPDPDMGEMFAIGPLDETGRRVAGRPEDWGKPGHDGRVVTISTDLLPRPPRQRPKPVGDLVTFQRSDGARFQVSKQEAEEAARAGLGKIVGRG